jgi:transposase
VREALAPLVEQLRNLDEAIARLDRVVAKLAQTEETARRLMSIPGFGPITASAMAATIQDASSFAGPREFAAYLGLTPKQNPFWRQAEAGAHFAACAALAMGLNPGSG